MGEVGEWVVAPCLAGTGYVSWPSGSNQPGADPIHSQQMGHFVCPICYLKQLKKLL